jgi:hypothetical protein
MTRVRLRSFVLVAGMPLGGNLPGYFLSLLLCFNSSLRQESAGKLLVKTRVLP